jgi:hypothetical protein
MKCKTEKGHLFLPETSISYDVYDIQCVKELIKLINLINYQIMIN